MELLMKPRSHWNHRVVNLKSQSNYHWPASQRDHQQHKGLMRQINQRNRQQTSRQASGHHKKQVRKLQSSWISHHVCSFSRTTNLSRRHSRGILIKNDQLLRTITKMINVTGCSSPLLPKSLVVTKWSQSCPMSLKKKRWKSMAHLLDKRTQQVQDHRLKRNEWTIRQRQQLSQTQRLIKQLNK